jgi:hypothetical protein
MGIVEKSVEETVNRVVDSNSPGKRVLNPVQTQGLIHRKKERVSGA